MSEQVLEPLPEPSATARCGAAKEISLLLPYQPPYCYDALLQFLATRSLEGVESVFDGRYLRSVALRVEVKDAAIRTVAVGNRQRESPELESAELEPPGLCYGWLAVCHDPGKDALQVSLSSSLALVLPTLLRRLRQVFDLDCDPVALQEGLCNFSRLFPAALLPGLRLPGCFDPFEMAVRAILGQQITVKAAQTLAGRLVAAYGEPVSTPFAALHHVFPSPARICALEPPIERHLGPLGIIGARARSIYALAKALEAGLIEMSPGVKNSTASSAAGDLQKKKLATLPGFGPWTVEYLAMRILDQSDAFPQSDYGILKALGGIKPKEAQLLAENWRPWRSYAVIALWNMLAEKQPAPARSTPRRSSIGITRHRKAHQEEETMTTPAAQALCYTCTIPTALGEMRAAATANGLSGLSGLSGLWFIGQKYYPGTTAAWIEQPDLPVFFLLREWLDAYFAGRQDLPTLPLAPMGTSFRKKVWDVLLTIPYGRLTTYGQIAAKLAEMEQLPSMSSQAVGGAVGHNPISLLIPCHRVVGVNRQLTGYAGGLDKKKALLALEQAEAEPSYRP